MMELLKQHKAQEAIEQRQYVRDRKRDQRARRKQVLASLLETRSKDQARIQVRFSFDLMLKYTLTLLCIVA